MKARKTSDMRWLRFSAIIVLPCIVGCLGLSSSSDLTSGIQGTITRGPICPVQMFNDPSCDDQPYAGTVVVSSEIGLEVTRFTAKDDGTFRVRLSPGVYTLTPLPGPNGFPHASPQEVTVPADTFVVVDISYDTGIR
jgi:hypothetical protein